MRASLFLICWGMLAVPPVAAKDSGAAAESEVELPPGEGRQLVRRACTGCHDLGGLAAFKGYYTSARWRDLVETMIEHGAELNAEERTAVTDYLAEHFGPESK